MRLGFVGISEAGEQKDVLKSLLSAVLFANVTHSGWSFDNPQSEIIFK